MMQQPSRISSASIGAKKIARDGRPEWYSTDSLQEFLRDRSPPEDFFPVNTKRLSGASNYSRGKEMFKQLLRTRTSSPVPETQPLQPGSTIVPHNCVLVKQEVPVRKKQYYRIVRDSSYIDSLETKSTFKVNYEFPRHDISDVESQKAGFKRKPALHIKTKSLAKIKKQEEPPPMDITLTRARPSFRIKSRFKIDTMPQRRASGKERSTIPRSEEHRGRTRQRSPLILQTRSHGSPNGMSRPTAAYINSLVQERPIPRESIPQIKDLTKDEPFPATDIIQSWQKRPSSKSAPSSPVNRLTMIDPLPAAIITPASTRDIRATPPRTKLQKINSASRAVPILHTPKTRRQLASPVRLARPMAVRQFKAKPHVTVSAIAPPPEAVSSILPKSPKSTTRECSNTNFLLDNSCTTISTEISDKESACRNTTGSFSVTDSSPEVLAGKKSRTKSRDRQTPTEIGSPTTPPPTTPLPPLPIQIAIPARNRVDITPDELDKTTPVRGSARLDQIGESQKDLTQIIKMSGSKKYFNLQSVRSMPDWKTDDDAKVGDQKASDKKASDQKTTGQRIVPDVEWPQPPQQVRSGKSHEQFQNGGSQDENSDGSEIRPIHTAYHNNNYNSHSADLQEAFTGFDAHPRTQHDDISSRYYNYQEDDNSSVSNTQNQREIDHNSSHNLSRHKAENSFSLPAQFQNNNFNPRNSTHYGADGYVLNPRIPYHSFDARQEAMKIIAHKKEEEFKTQRQGHASTSSDDSVIQLPSVQSSDRRAGLMGALDSYNDTAVQRSHGGTTTFNGMQLEPQLNDEAVRENTEEDEDTGDITPRQPVFMVDQINGSNRGQGPTSPVSHHSNGTSFSDGSNAQTIGDEMIMEHVDRMMEAMERRLATQAENRIAEEVARRMEAIERRMKRVEDRVNLLEIAVIRRAEDIDGMVFPDDGRDV